MSDIEYEIEPVESGDEETEYATLEYTRSLVTGELADRVRERFGVTVDTPVYFYEHQVEIPGCPTCYGIDDVLTVECGEHRRTFDNDDGLPLNDLLYWFDEPRRIREREEAKAARDLECKRNDEAFTGRIVGAFTTAVADVEATGYSDTGEWHDKVMDRLGVGGHRYRE